MRAVEDEHAAALSAHPPIFQAGDALHLAPVTIYVLAHATDAETAARLGE